MIEHWGNDRKSKNWQRIRAERIGIIAFVTTMQLQQHTQNELLES